MEGLFIASDLYLLKFICHLDPLHLALSLVFIPLLSNLTNVAEHPDDPYAPPYYLSISLQITVGFALKLILFGVMLLRVFIYCI